MNVPRLPRLALVALTFCLPSTLYARNWERWGGCRFQPTQYFDGDSFPVTHRGRTHILRLYFADAPETDESFPTRVREQAAYFRVTIPELLEEAVRAKEFTGRFLAKPFSVITRRQSAPGASRAPRLYARVERDGERLDEALIVAGLARATALAATDPNVADAQGEALRLRRLEQEAADARRGIWQHARRPPQSRANVTSHRVQVRLVNLNAATLQELEGLPGLGPKLAGRIVRARPLRGFDALEAIPGIGPRKVAALRPLVTFE